MKIKINKRVVGIVLGVIAVAGIAGGIAFAAGIAGLTLLAVKLLNRD